MATVAEHEVAAEWAKWLETRPEAVRMVGAILKPWRWYVMRHNNLINATDSYAFAVYRVASICEDGTVTVDKHERVFGGEAMHGVFGVWPKDLRELPVEFDFGAWVADWSYNVGQA